MLVFVFSALVALLDQLFKSWTVRAIPLGGEMELIPGVIGLTRLHNYGAAFGILAGMRWELVGIMFLCILFLIFIMLRYNEGFLGTLGLGAVLGGAIGNFIDRLFLGYVVDMFELRFVDFAIFNIADIFITLGALAFLTSYIISLVKVVQKTRAAKAAEKEQLEDEDDGDEYDGYYGYSDGNSADLEISVESFQEQTHATAEVTEEYGTQSHETPAEYTSPESYAVEYDESNLEYDAPNQTYSEEHEAVSEVEEYTRPTVLSEVDETYTRPPIVLSDVPEEESSLLSELASLEQELSQADSLSEINLDELLRDYGIENDEN